MRHFFFFEQVLHALIILAIFYYVFYWIQFLLMQKCLREKDPRVYKDLILWFHLITKKWKNSHELKKVSMLKFCIKILAYLPINKNNLEHFLLYHEDFKSFNLKLNKEKDTFNS